MKQLPTILKTLFAAVAVCCALSANAQIVQDGGFEASADSTSGNAFSAAWTLTPPSGPNPGQQFSNVGGDPAFAHSGNNYANLAPDQGQIGSLSQTISVAAGQVYTLSFWLANNSSVPTNFFQALINGAVIFTTTSPPFPITGTYQQVFASFTSNTNTATLEFRYRHDDDFWRLDDVAVDRGAVPEGGAPLWLALPLLGGLCLVHLRMRRASATS